MWPTGGALLAMLAAAPALAASHTISAGTVVYDGSVFGADDILVTGGTAVLEIDGGTVGNAVSLDLGGTLDNTGSIAQSGRPGVWAGVGIVNNGGGATIAGTGNDGVYFADGGTLLNTGAGSTITGGWNGVHVVGYGTVTNTDGAAIVGGGAISSAAVYLEGGGEVTNGAGARIVGDASAGVYGIYATQDATVGNAGDIAAMCASPTSARTT